MPRIAAAVRRCVSTSNILSAPVSASISCVAAATAVVVATAVVAAAAITMA